MTDIHPDIDEEGDVAKEILETKRIEVGGEKAFLYEYLSDIRQAHDALDSYKTGSLALSQTLKEERIEAEKNGDDVLAQILKDMEDSSFGVYLRIQRGDLELTGERDGEYSDYYKDEQ